ncbi:10563_t:CDS:1, partial [Dentiscutata erythropus]
ISDYIADTTANLEPDDSLILAFCVKLDEDTLSAADVNVRMIAKLIVDEVEKGDGYNWV